MITYARFLWFFVVVLGHKHRPKREVVSSSTIVDPLLNAGMFEGDIVGVDAKTVAKAVAETKFWPTDTIPYQIDDNLGHVARRALDKAMKQIESKTCVRFVNASDSDRNLVAFGAFDRGCYSNVGMQEGRQEISIDVDCEQTGIVLHLLMHLLGFWHEESRADRDSYVLINWDNIRPEDTAQFGKYSVPRINVASAVDPNSSPYDYRSITHMSPFAFAIDPSSPTILSKDERFTIGQRLELSQNDVNAIVRRYCGQRQVAPQSDTLTSDEKIVFKQTLSHSKISGKPTDPGDQSGDADQEEEEPEQPVGCRDTSGKCPLWATQGFCYKNSELMANKCPGSCQACQLLATCDDYNALCGVWAWLNYCVGGKAQKYLSICPLACGICQPEGSNAANATVRPPVAGTTSAPRKAHTTSAPRKIHTTKRPSSDCKDTNADCHKWFSKGQCFYRHIQLSCPRSCKTCTTGKPSTSTSSNSSKPCKDNRKNCQRSLSKGFCQRPLFRKQCQLSCNVCNIETLKRTAD